MKKTIFCAALVVSAAFSTAAVAYPGGKWVLTGFKSLDDDSLVAELQQCTYTKPGKTPLNVDIYTMWPSLLGCQFNVGARVDKAFLMDMGAY
jgi:hypothetical protein